MKEDRIFLDTNVMVYAYDLSAGRKREIAGEILRRLWTDKCGVVSVQVLQEFFVTVTKKIGKPVEPKTAKDIVKDLLTWRVVPTDGQDILSAIDIHMKYGYSFWDSMVIHTAISGGANLLYSEDLSHGQVISGTEIRNPFA